MRKRRLILLYVCTVFCLSGCRGHIFSGRMDMERLRPVQTMGLDRQGSGVVLTVSAGSGPEEEPLVLTGFASSIESAMDRLQDWSPEDELFYAHVSYILLGSGMTDDSVLPLLDWVERSPAMRMGSAMLLVRDSAADALTGAAGEATDITERLASLEREEDARGQHIYTLREIAASFLERGCALCVTVRSVPSDGVIYTASEAAAAVLPEGCAVLREDAEPAFLTPEETLGTQLMAGPVNGALAEVEGNVLELFSPGAEAAGLWDDNGELTAIFIRCRIRAGILERKEGCTADPDALEKALQKAAEGWLCAAAARSQALGCDFLDLEAAAVKSAPRRADTGDFSSAFPELPVTALADARIDRSYDRSDRGEAS